MKSRNREVENLVECSPRFPIAGCSITAARSRRLQHKGHGGGAPQPRPPDARPALVKDSSIAIRGLPSIRGIVKPEEAMKNFHLPLPEQTYRGLRAEAERTGVPSTALAREAVDWWLRQQGRKARHDAIAAYATEMAGTRLDLDADLESAAIEHILSTSKAAR